MSSSTKPYLLRALYEWCVDNDQTPHIVAWVNEQTRVPMQYVRDNEIVLNIGPSASHNLIIDNEWVSFSARFGGVSHEVWIPIGHVISLSPARAARAWALKWKRWKRKKTTRPSRRTLPMRKMPAKKPMRAQSKPVRKAMAINRKKA